MEEDSQGPGTLMTTSLPPTALAETCDERKNQTEDTNKMTKPNGSVRVTDLDLLESKLERFVSQENEDVNAKQVQSEPVPSPRKKSLGSQIPKPEIAPKPKSLLPTTSSSGKQSQDNMSQKNNSSKTASMLKSTLKRMTRLTMSSSTNSLSSKDNKKTSPDVSNGTKKRHVSPSTLDRCKSFKEPLPVDRKSQRNTVMSSSLRRPKSKDSVLRDDSGYSRYGTMQRSGTGGTLERRSLSRSHSVTGKRFRDRDVNVRKSRGIQTLFTRDVLVDDDDEKALDNDQQDGHAQVEFSLYVPELLGSGADVDAVETHFIEPNEPVDVRKNRQLTLENMKLQREVERLRSQATENDTLKKELRSVKAKLEDEQKHRIKIEKELDQHNEKVRMIVQSMDTVERQFETRDENIMSLENRIEEYRGLVSKLQHDLDASNDMIACLQQEIENNLAAQKLLLNQCHEAETESRELQEFLQAEKMTLAETLKDCENEIDQLKAKLEEKDKEVASAEERCHHLVRLGEQRHQENLSLQAQLNTVQEKTKDMLLAQGAEISRASIHIADLQSRLEKLSVEAGIEDTVPSDSFLASNYDNADTVSIASNTLPPATAFSRSSSQFLVSSSTADLGITMSSSTTSMKQQQGQQESTSSLEFSESLQNLSKAITQRQTSENNGELEESMTSSHSSLPSLVDRICEVQNLMERIIRHQTKSNGQSLSQNDKDKKTSEEKENHSFNGVANLDEVIKKKESEINEMKNKFLKHRQILVSNYEQAEHEIRRLDEIYHDMVDQVLKALKTIPDVVKRNGTLQQLQKDLELASLSDAGDQTSPKKEISISKVLKSDIKANQSL